MKVKLVLQPDRFTSFTSWYLESLWQEYFDIEIYSLEKTYDARTLFVTWWNDPVIDTDHKIVIDNLWETHNPKFDQFFQLNNPNWWWWNESLWWRALGYHEYIPNKTYTKLALMPMRAVKPARDLIIEKLESYLNQMYWSYKDQRLPNDFYLDNSTDVNQRYMNPSWYDDCCINLVVETSQHTGLIVSEKSYKPCAFYQPMLLLGIPGALNFLKTQGFETFNNMFDESYDSITDFSSRLECVIDNLRHVQFEPYSDLTWEKLKHNHNHFFDQALVKNYIVKEIVEPLLNYAET